MRRFLKNILLFALLMVMPLAWLEWNARQKENIYKFTDRALTLGGDSISTLFIGSSITYWGIDPAEWPEKGAFNIARVSQLPQVSLAMMRQYIDSLPNLTTVFIEASPITLYDSPWDTKENERTFWIPYTLYNHLPIKSRWSRSGFEIFALQTARMKAQPWESETRQMWDSLGHAVYRPLAERYTHWDYDGLIMTAQLRENGTRYLRANSLFTQSLVALLQSKGVQPVLVSLPIRRGALANLKPDLDTAFINESRRISELYSIPFLDFTRCGLPDYCYWDGMHLNTDVGSSRFTDMLYREWQTHNPAIINKE